MTEKRITVGYVELTEDESQELYEQVSKDKKIDGYEGLQSLMEDFDSRIIEPESKPLADVLDAEEAPAEEKTRGIRFIEIFNKLEEDSRYRVQSSNQD